jgi:hypothetical protein
MSHPHPPSGGSREAVSVLPVPKAGELSVLFLGPYQGLLTHWHSGRSWPCPGLDECPAAIHRARCVWKGYAPVLAWDVLTSIWRPRVLELTEVLEEKLRGRNLAGEVWLLYRVEAGRKSAPIEAVHLERRPSAELPAPFDVTAPLLRFYHVTNLTLGVPNPLPGKLLLEGISAPAPRLPVLPPSPADIPPTPEQLARLRELAGHGRTRPLNKSNVPEPGDNGKH